MRTCVRLTSSTFPTKKKRLVRKPRRRRCCLLCGASSSTTTSSFYCYIVRSWEGLLFLCSSFKILQCLSLLRYVHEYAVHLVCLNVRCGVCDVCDMCVPTYNTPSCVVPNSARNKSANGEETTWQQVVVCVIMIIDSTVPTRVVWWIAQFVQFILDRNMVY